MTIPGLTSTFMGFTAFICIASPFIFWLVVREKVQFRQALFGLVVYFLFVILLKGMLDTTVLSQGALTSKLPYVLYVALSAAVFEEVSKFAFFKFYLKNKYDRCGAAVGFAIGFAAYSCFYVGIMAISNFALALTLNSYGIETVIAESAPESAEELRTILEAMCSANPLGFLMEGVNKFFYLIQQIALSIIIWYAATREDSPYLLPVSVVLSAVSAIPMGIYQFDGSLTLVNSGLVYCGVVILTALFAYWLYKKNEPVYYDFKPDRLQARRRR